MGLSSFALLLLLIQGIADPQRNLNQNESRIDISTVGCRRENSFDNYTCIREAIRRVAASGGGIVVIPSGAWHVFVPTNQCISVPANVVVEGFGEASRLVWRENEQSHKSLFCMDGNHSGLRNFAAYSQRSLTQGIDFVTLRDASNIVIERMHFHGQREAGYAGSHGIEFVGSANNLSISDSTFEGLSFATFKTNSRTTTQRGIRINNNAFFRNSGDDVNLNTPNGHIYDVSIAGNTFSENQSRSSAGGFGITLARTVNVSITGNTFDSYPREAIHVEDLSTAVTISNNVFRNCALLAGAGYGVIHVISGSEASISANSIDGSRNTLPAAAINFVPGGGARTERVSIVGNTIRLSRELNGIVGASSSQVVIANNVITGPGLVDGRTYSGGDNRGIDFTDSTEIAVTGNSVRGVGIGIGALHTLLVGDSQTISNNVVSHTRYGISLRPAGDSVVTGNIIRNCVNPIAVSSNTRIPKTAIITGNSAVSCLNPMEIDGMTRSIVRDNIEGNAQRLAGDSWRKYAVGKVDAGSSGCTAPTGCWVVNNQPPVPVQETQAQSLPIGAIGTNAFVEAIRIQTNVPFSGATTVAAEIGVVGEENLFLAAGYDLMAAKSSENFADIIPSRGAKTTGQSTILLTIRATGRSLRYIQSGASLDLWVRWSTLQ